MKLEDAQEFWAKLKEKYRLTEEEDLAIENIALMTQKFVTDVTTLEIMKGNLIEKKARLNLLIPVALAFLLYLENDLYENAK